MALTKIEKEKQAFREKENKRKREWRARKKMELRVKHAHDGSQIQASSIMRMQEGMSPEEHRKKLEKDGMKLVSKLSSKKRPVTQSHPSKPIKTPSSEKSSATPAPAPRRRLRLRFRSRISKEERWRMRREKAARKAQQKFAQTVPVAYEPVDQPDVTEEQVEKPQTTKHCPESIKEDGLSEVKKNPEYYIEINMVTKSRVVDTFYIPTERKKFHYKSKEYRVDEEAIYLLPTRLGLFMPTCHYKEGVYTPRGFRQTNKGITGKALSLLYMEQLYTSLLYSEDMKYNFFIVILSIAILIAYGVGCYFLFVHNGGALPQNIPAPPALLMRMLP